MKILYIKLKNFATIYTAMKRKEIEIDFTKSKNKVVLLVGANGSGKTSILSSLHPYAYLGSLDVRNSTGLIRDGEDGYKEIHYQKDKDIYVIKHFYMFSKKTSTLKSFISKNGVELNPNGNVGSFNEIVNIELSLKQDFLRLIRLGSNVNNLIDLKATERKAFTSNLLSDMNVYADLFKKISDDNRIIRGLIKSVSDKINRLNISDIGITQSEIDKVNKDLAEQGKIKDTYQKELGALEGRLSDMVPDGIESLSNSIRELKSERKSANDRLLRMMSELKSMLVIIPGDIDDAIDSLKQEISKVTVSKQLADNMIMFYKEQLNKLYDTKDSILNKIKLITTDNEYYHLLDLKVELFNKIDKYKERFSNYVPVYSKEELLLLMNKLDFINNIAKEIYAFDLRALKTLIPLIRSGDNIEKYIASEKKKIDAKILATSSKAKIDAALSQPIVVFKPQGCKIPECPYIYLFESIFSDDKTSSDDISKLQTQKDILSEMENIYRNIDYIFMIVKSNTELIKKGDISYFKISSILNRLEKTDNLFDEDVLTDMISEAEDYEDYINSKSELQKVLSELKAANNKQDNIDNLKSELNTMDEEISKMLKMIEDKESEVKHDIYTIDTISDDIDNFERYKELSTSISEISLHVNTLDSDILTLENRFKDVEEISKRINEITSLIKGVDWQIDKLNSDLFIKKVAMQDFIKLSEEKKILNEKFDDIELIRDALSSTKGIPLLYIQLYLKNTTIYVNNLLQSVYGDDFAIDDFEISATEFNIPYIKNGVRINDVAYASQGEKSFLSLALSFALINQSIKEYNILLLDEIDSTLDPKNRAMFLNILEKQMEIISADQIFLITHNNMFDSYPVDIILTSDSKLENYNNANIIFTNA